MTHTELKQKLLEVGIPEEQASAYSNGYRHGFSEYTFKDSEPTDENFKLLNRYKGQKLTAHNIKSILSVNPRQVLSVKELISNLTGKSLEEVDELYNDHNVLYLDAYEARYIFELIQEYFPDDKNTLFKVYSKAVTVGMFHAETCIDAIVESVGEELASKVLFETVTKGFLYFSSDYLDAAEAIRSLRKQLDSKTTAKLLIEHPEYIYLFRYEGYIESPEQKKKRDEEIQRMIEMYK